MCGRQEPSSQPTHLPADEDPPLPSRPSLLGAIRGFAAANAVPLWVFAANRLGLSLLAYLTLVLVPIGKVPWRAYPNNLLLDGWFRWDSEWYIRIVVDGYTNIPREGWQAGQRDTAFFPFYPLVVKAVGAVLGEPLIAGLLVSNLAFLAALVLLHRLVTHLHGARVAERTLLLVGAYPFSFFFGAMYTESLFLLAAVAAFYFGEQRRWACAGLAAAAAGATRVVGLGVMAGLVLLYLELAWRSKARLRPDALWTLLGLLGPLGYMGYLALRFDDPLLFISNQYAGWGKADLASALEAIRLSLSPTALLSGHFPAVPLLHLVVALGSVVLLIATWGRVRITYTIWGLLMVFLSLSLWRGMGRFTAVIFPLFISAALLLRDDRKLLVVLWVSTLLLALFAGMFARFAWVA